MHGVGPGSALGGRYHLTRPVTQHPRYERWLADDQTLSREVVLLCFPAGGAPADAAVDAARRAAGLEESRLVRVLDVGADDGTAFVVEEPLSGGRTLTELLDDGTLPSEEVRRIVGESASALETARVRGLHHGALGPRSVLRLPDGAVKVRGLATEAALLGIDEDDGATASRTDAVSLVAITYAALTGRWPLTGIETGLDPAPVVVGGVAAPSEIAAGVPADLDTICRLTLGTHGGGPVGPGDLAAQIAPWSPTPYAAALVRPARPRPAESEPTDADAGSVLRSAVSASGPPAAPRQRSATVLGMSVDGTSHGAGAAATAAATAGPAAAAAGSSAGAAGAAGAADGRGAAGADLGPHTDELSQAAAPDPATRPQRAGDTGPMRIIRDVRLSDTLEESDDDLEGPLPMLGGRGRGASDVGGDSSKVALVAVAVLVVVAAVLGIVGVSRIGRSDTPTAASSSSTSTTTTTTATPSATASASATSAPLAEVAIVQAQAWDPEGDNQEGNASAPRAIDKDPASMWRSQAYQSAAFGGFAKSGIGLILDLGQQTDVRQVQVDLAGGADLTVYVASRESLDGAIKVGSSAGADGTQTFTPTGGTAKGQLVILWFTKLAPDGSGSYRAQVREARVSS